MRYDAERPDPKYGGTASVIGGGKFANGAETAAFAHIFNDGFTSEHSGAKWNGIGPPPYLANAQASLAQQLTDFNLAQQLTDFIAGAWDGFNNVVDHLIYSQSSGMGETAPSDAPPNTIGLDKASRKYGWDKDTSHEIKNGATGGMGTGKTWVGVAPDGSVGINEYGRWSPQGHYNELK